MFNFKKLICWQFSTEAGSSQILSSGLKNNKRKVLDPNTMNLNSDPEFWPNLDPDLDPGPDLGLCYPIWKEEKKL